MKKPFPKYPRILAISPTSKGFGFALIEGLNTLVDWGVKCVKGDKNAGCIAKVKEMIIYYAPDVIALEDTSHKSVRRSARIRTLTKRIMRSAEKQGVRAMCFLR